MSKNQKRTKTPLYYFIILCVLLIIGGCSKNKPTYQDTYILEDDYQYYLSHGAAENEQGYFFTRFDANTGILVYYLDKESMKATVLCNKPECKHDDENCNAQFSIQSGISNTLSYSNGYLYYINTKLLENGGTSFVLERMTTEGTGREELTELLAVANNTTIRYECILHRGYMYYALGYPDDETGLTGSMELYRVELKRSAKPKSIFIKEGFGGTINGITGYGNNIYFTFSYFSKDLNDRYVNMYSYDLKNEKFKEIAEDANLSQSGQFVILDGKLYYKVAYGGIWAYDFETSKSEVFISQNEPYDAIGALSTDDTYLYFNNTNGRYFIDGMSYEDCFISVYKTDGTLLNKIGMQDMKIMDVVGGRDCCLAWFIEDNKDMLYYFDKSKLGSGSTLWTLAAEYNR